jgi:hypothetical protein
MKTLMLLTSILFLSACVTLNDNFVGVYEGQVGEFSLRYAFLDNGVVEVNRNGEKVSTSKWTIKNSGFLDARGQVHVEDKNGDVDVFRIKSDGSLTHVAYIVKGERKDTPKSERFNFKKIK